MKIGDHIFRLDGLINIGHAARPSKRDSSYEFVCMVIFFPDRGLSTRFLNREEIYGHHRLSSGFQ